MTGRGEAAAGSPPLDPRGQDLVLRGFGTFGGIAATCSSALATHDEVLLLAVRQAGGSET